MKTTRIFALAFVAALLSCERNRQTATGTAPPEAAAGPLGSSTETPPPPATTPEDTPSRVQVPETEIQPKPVAPQQ